MNDNDTQQLLGRLAASVDNLVEGVRRLEERLRAVEHDIVAQRSWAVGIAAGVSFLVSLLPAGWLKRVFT